MADTTTGMSKVSLSDQLKRSGASIFQGESLKARVFRGGVWLGAGSFSEQVIRFGRNMILTRLLAPEAFGTMAIVLSACSVIQTIMDVGVREALIQNPRGNEDEYVGAAWWMAFGRGAMFWAIVSLVAPIIAKFYGNPDLSSLFRVAAIGVLFDGALSSRAYVAIKEMKFRKWAIINHGGAIVGVFATVALSFLLRNVWALILGYCAESIGRFILSFALCPFLPPYKLPLPAIRDLLTFSKRAFGLSVLNLIFARTDIFVLAKLFSPGELGLYTMAIYLIQTPTGFVLNLLGQTMLPTYSRIQGDNPRTNRAFIRVTFALLLVGMPTVIFIFICGRSLLTVLYGPRYATAAWSLMIASLVALLNAANGQVTTIFYARGLPQLHRRCVLITASTMIILIYPLVKSLGFVGGQVAALIAITLGFLFQVIRMHKITRLDLAQYSKVLGLCGGISLAVAVLGLGARIVTAAVRPVPDILVGIATCATACALGVFVYSRIQLKETV